jgi:hypothetical protein
MDAARSAGLGSGGDGAGSSLAEAVGGGATAAGTAFADPAGRTPVGPAREGTAGAAGSLSSNSADAA